MANKMFWSYWVEGRDASDVAEMIGDVVGDERSVTVHNQLMTQLGTVVYMLSRRYEVTVTNHSGTVSIEGKGFSLTLTEKWMLERKLVWNNIS